LGVDRLDHGVRRRRQEPVDEMRAWDGFRLRATVALEFGSEDSEPKQRPAVVKCEPHDVFLGLRVRLRRVFGKTVHRHQAAFSGFIRKLPLSLRKSNLARLLARRVDGIFLCDFEQGEIGPDLYRHACLLGLEGLVSKLRDRPYRAGRSPNWVKVKNRQHPAFSRVLDRFYSWDIRPAPVSNITQHKGHDRGSGL
jgi:hypothetical protein